MSKLKGTDDLVDEKDTTLQDILLDLMDGDTNLELKTQIFNPKDLACLTMIGDVLAKYKLKKSSSLILAFITDYLRNMVSYQRKSRTELVTAISGLLDREERKKSFGDKMNRNID